MIKYSKGIKWVLGILFCFIPSIVWAQIEIPIKIKGCPDELQDSMRVPVANYQYNWKQYVATNDEQYLVDSYPYWKKIVEKCPRNGINLYIRGVNIMEAKIKRAMDAKERGVLIKELMSLYDTRIANYGDAGKVITLKAMERKQLLGSHTKIYSSEKKIKEVINKQDDGIVGIYRDISSSLDLAVVVQNECYIIVFLHDAHRDNSWTCGDLKATLTSTATKGLFQANWFLPDYSVNDQCFAIFDGSTMKVVANGQEITLLKMYPTAVVGGDASRATSWSGSGFAIAAGYIVTNNHVVDGAKKINVKGINGDLTTSYSAKVVASDAGNDIAIIKVIDDAFSGFGTIPYGLSSSMAESGDDVFVLGYPLTQALGNEIKLTNGIISSRTGYQGDMATYQISAPVQPGNSGGPMFNSKGNVIGIVVAGVPGAENVGYAIKTSYLINLIESARLNINIPSNNTISALSLTNKVKQVRNFVFYIECSK